MADVLPFPPLPLFEASLPGAQEPEQAISPPELSDAPARAAALDIHRSWIVEAPAGSGKTGLLIQRFLKLLAHGDVHRPNEILAITFTRKAANELRARVLEQLEAARRGDPPKDPAAAYERVTRQLALSALERDRTMGWRLLESPHQLNIRTIDSFCGDLASRVPLLSEGAGRRQPTDDTSPLYEEAARRTIRELGGPDRDLTDALRCVLLHRDGQIGDCVRLIADMLANREQWGELVPLQKDKLNEEFLDSEVRQRLERALKRVVCHALSRAARAVDPALLGELALFAARLSTEPGYNAEFSPLTVCAGRPGVPGTTEEHLEHWLALVHLLLKQDGAWRVSASRNHLKFELSKNDSQWLKQFLGHLRSDEQQSPELREALCALRCLPPVCYPDAQWRVAKALFRVLRRSLAELNVLFSELGVCDFTDVALTARALLRSEGAQAELLNAPGAQLSHLLVDEMQDTSTGQYELFELLTRQWDGRTQTVFLVGDPKQSIYAFRQARVERFLRTQSTSLLGDVPLQPLRLTANFRSQASLVDDFNQTFGRILPPPQASHEGGPGVLEVPFVAAEAVRPRGKQPALVWHTQVAPPDPGFDDPDRESDLPAPSAEQDARTIRGIIETFLHRHRTGPVPIGGKPSSPRVAVLARSRAHLAPVIAEFHRDRGHGPLPFRAVDIELLNERPEVLDLLALTRALLHPADRVAWLALLRSPVCGLGLPDLLRLTGEGPGADPGATVGHLVRTRAHLLSPEGQLLLGRAWPVLDEAQASLGRTLFSTHVERTWRSLGADALLRADQMTNARRFLRLLQELESGPDPLSVPLFERRLRKLYAEPSSGAADVELMTIHKSKGLEWDLVLIPALERGAGSSRHELLKWLELDGENGSQAEVVLAPIASKGDLPSPLSDWLSALQRSRETAEAKRLFYVACTRAREELHLFAACSQKASGELRLPRHDSLLRASWAAAEPAILQQLAGGSPSTALPEASEHPWGAPLNTPPHDPAPLALAASAEAPHSGEIDPNSGPRPASVQRLPQDFDPLARFQRDTGPQLPYPPASALRHRAAFARPEGTFAARAFGNVVHRFLELAAERLSGGQTLEDLIAELPGWGDRIRTSFRAEGVPLPILQCDSARALQALAATLQGPEGRWLLSPHPGARNERGLQLTGDPVTGAGPRNLRADRVFLAGPDPLSMVRSHLWIVDFKTAEPGGRDPKAFLETEKVKYLPQMQAYARAAASAGGPTHPIMLALFYPALTQLLYWPFDPFMASQQIESATDTVRR